MYVIEHAHVLQCAYNEAQGLLEFESPTILGLLGSKWYLSYPLFVLFGGGGEGDGRQATQLVES